MKSLVLLASIFAVATLSAEATPQLTWENVPPTSTVSQIVQQFSPPTSLAPATNYTDSATNALAQSQASKLSQASQSATNYTDSATSNIQDRLNSGTVNAASTAEYADVALHADGATAAEGLFSQGEERTASEIFSALDGASHITTNDVCNIVTNEVAEYTAWEIDAESYATGFRINEISYTAGVWYLGFVIVDEYGQPTTGGQVSTDGTEDATELHFEQFPTVALTRRRIVRNALGLARLEDIPTNHVTKAELDAAIDAIPEVDTSRFATKAALAAVSNESALVTRLFTSSNVILEVTNYNSAVNSPKLRILQLNESNEYHVVWAETNNLTRTLAAATNDAAAKMAEMAAHTASTYAPRAWSRTTSGMGVDAPSNTTWISTPTTVIAGGLEYAKVVHSGGAIWVLSGNGMMQFDPTTNAYLRISADDGMEIFSIEKTDAVTVGAFADGITVSRGDGVTTVGIPVNVVSAEHPTMYYRRRLDDEAGWISEADFNGELGLVNWSGRSGAWLCEINMSATGTANSGFFKFTYEQPGSTLIKHNAPMDVSGGIMCTDGVHRVRPVYSNGSVTWEVVP